MGTQNETIDDFIIPEKFKMAPMFTFCSAPRAAIFAVFAKI